MTSKKFGTTDNVSALKKLLKERSYTDEPSVSVVEPEIRSPTQYAMLGSLRKAVMNKQQKKS